jgi:hypothetical protein
MVGKKRKRIAKVSPNYFIFTEGISGIDTNSYVGMLVLQHTHTHSLSFANTDLILPQPLRITIQVMPICLRPT